MASAVPELITGKFGELVWDEATLLWSFKDDVGNLKETMDLLQALMHDADKRQKNQYEGKTVQLWMKKFKSVAYDVEDLLDKLEAIQLIKQTQSKVLIFTWVPFPDSSMPIMNTLNISLSLIAPKILYNFTQLYAFACLSVVRVLHIGNHPKLHLLLVHS